MLVKLPISVGFCNHFREILRSLVSFLFFFWDDEDEFGAPQTAVRGSLVVVYGNVWINASKI
ncbi:hypothetical protein [Maribacter sp. 2307ULW6-5]|uniref:hypothetical protein n=1 Tax=Maribacter sp. 2307ULW6-5 TaxID=3386275 RepID=UPI0039BC2C6B